MVKSKPIPATPEAISRAYEHIKKHPTKFYDQEPMDTMMPGSDMAMIKFTANKRGMKRLKEK